MKGPLLLALLIACGFLAACAEEPKATEDDKAAIDRMTKEGISPSPAPEDSGK